jgi:hypothetical protein
MGIDSSAERHTGFLVDSESTIWAFNWLALSDVRGPDVLGSDGHQCHSRECFLIRDWPTAEADVTPPSESRISAILFLIFDVHRLVLTLTGFGSSPCSLFRILAVGCL